MFKVLFIALCVAIYFFSTITYTPAEAKKSFAKANNSWSFIELSDPSKDKVSDHFWFTFFVSTGINGEEKPKTIEFSYLKK